MKTFQELQEGLYDPNIFKAFFLAGGPGSGKSEVIKGTGGGHGLKIVNSDDAFEVMMKKAGLSLKMPPEEEERKDVVRGRAKTVTVKRHDNYVEGRLGLIIDSTARDSAKILQHKAMLEELGYDTHMVYVNTSLDVALARNAQRDRSVAEPIVVKSWKDVQANIGTFSQAFRGRFIVVDNNDPLETMKKDIFPKIWKLIRGQLKKKVANTRAKNWMAMELAKKAR